MTYRAIVAEYLKARFNVTDERGATAVEYGLLVGLIAVAIVTVLLLIGPSLTALFTTVNTSLQPRT